MLNSLMGVEESLDSLVLMGDSRVGLIVRVAIRHCSGPATWSHLGVSAWHGQTVNNKQQAPHTVLVRPASLFRSESEAAGPIQ